MANTNYPQELIALVEEYLTDGIISAKERQVLLKKAQELGVDVDEFDLYIDAQQQKSDQAVDAITSKKRGKTCPFCGSPVPMLTDKCPNCGETITPEASEELQEIFENLEEALVDFKSGNDIEKSKATVERYVRKAKMYYGNNPKVQKLLAEVQNESNEALAQAKKNARNNRIMSILTYNKKLTASVIVGLLAVIIIAIFSSTLKSDDAILKEQSEHVTSLVSSGDLASADQYLVNITILEGVREEGTSNIVDKYDAMFFCVINEYLKNEDYNSAEALALVYRSKIGNDLSWVDSSCYATLRARFAQAGRDFSTLKSKYDYSSSDE